MSELDDFDEIESQGSMATGSNISNVYTVRLGGFGINTDIKTYLTTLHVNELENDVVLYETLSNDKDWPVSQIIQREVDKGRINEITKKYLLGKGRDVKYFPPIIVALLPRETDGSFAKAYDFQADQENDIKDAIVDKSKYRHNSKLRETIKGKNNDSNVSGLYFYNTYQVLEHHILCWDKNKMFAVVIDGQHRLDALIQGQKEDAAYGSALQDVVFLDVSALVARKPALTPVQVLRTIFIDINTNAKSVGLVRRILMDDKDLASLCVQSLVESIYKDGTSKPEESYLPSALIDWYGESLKHELPHITGLLTMHQIISDELVARRLVSIEDHRDHGRIKDFIEKLNSYFFVDYTIGRESEFSGITTLATSFSEYLEQKEITREMFALELNQESLDSILFTYDYRVLEVAQRNFEKYYLRSMVQVFEKTLPYNKVIEFLRSRDAFNVKSNLYKSLVSKMKKIATTPNLKSAYVDAKKELNETFNKQYFLFYSVVGQKGVFRRFFEDLDETFSLGSTEETVLNTQRNFVNRLNAVLEMIGLDEFWLFGKDETFIDNASELEEEFGTVVSSFWEGILFEDGRIIYNSQGVRAFADVIKLVLKIHSALQEDLDTDDLERFPVRFSTQRTKRLLTKRFGDRPDLEWDRVSNLILNHKKSYLIKRITLAYTNQLED